jgi:hypothetical protein
MTQPDHGARLTRAEAAIEALAKGQEIIFGKLDSQSAKMDATSAAQAAKMDAIVAGMHEMRSSAGASWRDMLSVIRDGAVLFSLVVAGILYLATATSSRSDGDLVARLSRLETIIGLATGAPKRSGIVWSPEMAGR